MLPTLRDKMEDLREMRNLFDRDLFKWTDMFDTYMTSDEQGNKVLEVDVPGFNEDNLTVSKDGQVLFISGENGKGRKLSKSMTVPVNTDNVEAKVKDGVLEVTFYQSQEQQGKKIPVSGESE